MKLEQLSFADLIALRQEFKDRIKKCHDDRYLVLVGKIKDGPSREHLLQKAEEYCIKLEIVKREIDFRFAIILDNINPT